MARLLLFPAKKQHYCYWRNGGDTLMHWPSQGDTSPPPRLLKFSKIISVKQSLTDIEEKRKRKIRLLLESDSDTEKRRGKKSSHTPNHAFVL